MVRLASANEAPEIASIILESFAELRQLYTKEGFDATTPNADVIGERFAEGPVWVAQKGSELVGTVSAVIKRGEIYIRSMAVMPAFRGEGIAKRLLREVELYALERDCKRMYLNTTPFLFSAIRLYQEFGFRKIDSGPGGLFGTPLFTMEKTLR